MQPIVRRVDLGDQGTFYRLMAGSYASLSDAEAACIKLKEAGQFCRASATGS
ncbi:MAG: SPOR domain-containing protein [Rhodospirillaceae bacterium]|nr:SPOR domain-containing protein [Rhodospirillaceae bacterium]